MRYAKYTPFLFIAPMLVGLLVFRLLPIGVSFGASFTSWNVFAPPQWIGLANYQEMIRSSYVYQNAFVHFRLGYASALAYALLLFVGTLTLVNFYFRRRWVHYG